MPNPVSVSRTHVTKQQKLSILTTGLPTVMAAKKIISLGIGTNPTPTPIDQVVAKLNSYLQLVTATDTARAAVKAAVAAEAKAKGDMDVYMTQVEDAVRGVLTRTDPDLALMGITVATPRVVKASPKRALKSVAIAQNRQQLKTANAAVKSNDTGNIVYNQSTGTVTMEPAAAGSSDSTPTTAPSSPAASTPQSSSTPVSAPAAAEPKSS